MKFDIAIAHRVCPSLSKSAVGFKDKRELVRKTTSSLHGAMDGLNVRLFVLLDDCPDYESIFLEEFSSDKHVTLSVEKLPGIGNQGTWGRQLEILNDFSEADVVYFSEDDYLYRKKALYYMLDFATRTDVDMVTPLDHPDFYNGYIARSSSTELAVSSYCHWRKCGSTCLTFMIKSQALKRTREIFEGYLRSREEGTMWLAVTKENVWNLRILFRAGLKVLLRKAVPFGNVMQLCAWKRQGLHILTTRRYNLWAPIPTLAVHLSRLSLPLHAEYFWEDEDVEAVREITLKYLTGE